MSNTRENFQKWYCAVIRRLYHDPDAGFVIVIATLPILERYLRQRLNIVSDNLPDAFFDELSQLLPFASAGRAKDFWRSYRHGLFHQLTLPHTTRTGHRLPVASLSSDTLAIEFGLGNTIFVNPAEFAEKVLQLVESDFLTFERKGEAVASLPGVYISPYGTSTGIPHSGESTNSTLDDLKHGK